MPHILQVRIVNAYDADDYFLAANGPRFGAKAFFIQKTPGNVR